MKVLVTIQGWMVLLLVGVLLVGRAGANEAHKVIFITELEGGPQLYSATLAGDNLQQLSFNPNYDKGWLRCPLASPDGLWIAAVSSYLESDTFYTLRDRWGGHEIEFVLANNADFECQHFAWAGGWLYYTLNYNALYRVHPMTPEQPELVAQSELYMGNLNASPDEQWLFYTANPATVFMHLPERRQLYFSLSGAECKVTWGADDHALCAAEDNLLMFDLETVYFLNISEGNQAAWSPDGAWLVFWDERQLWRMHPDGNALESLFMLGEEYEFDNAWQDMTPLWYPTGDKLLLPNLCIEGEYGARCRTFTFSLEDRQLTPFAPLYRDTYADGSRYEQPVGVRNPQFLPPLTTPFNPLPLLVSGVGLLLVGGLWWRL